jgi:hypothetical protein
MNLDHLEGKELFKALKANKDTIIKSKTSSIKYADSIISTPSIVSREPKTTVVKEDGSSDDPTSDRGTIDVTVVCNTAWFCDSHMDVLSDTAYDDSIAAKGNAIPHISDHKWESTSHVGDVTKVYTKSIALRDLGLDQDGEATALLMDSTVRKDYNEDVYRFYKNGKINQHSIGLTYGALALALNSEDEEDIIEYTTWKEHYDKIINKELVDKKGYFWYVPKVDIVENSCVLFGANGLTPTLSSKTYSSLGNTEVNVVNQPTSKGVTMTLEEAQGKIASLTVELASAKTELASAKAAASLEERTRVSSIIKAANTFGIAIAAAEKFIEKGSDIETVTVAFETIKEAAQAAGHVDTSTSSFGTASQKSDFKEPKDDGKIFKSAFDEALEAKHSNPFEGVI